MGELFVGGTNVQQQMVRSG
ncbi:hypothetical protein [Synechococcus sp. LTW-R]|nr:hypothetical protein [Synechococcus sp. LTW-R]